uniref:RNase H type-1 domain-containing protein n=1 Tax=Nicotiana tabacum TaxID=4097 RepID=A0A1S3XYG3_TOBAC|nr:PREDICTED: uncharacterized protein LOC107770133 [Nicotiana tabacum]
MPLAAKEELLVSGTISGVWTLFTNGASNVKRSGLGIALITLSRETLRQAIRTVPLTNNEVEYENLVVGLELAWGLGSEMIQIKCDYSQIVVHQEYGIFDTKEELTEVTKFLEGMKIKWITSLPYHPSAIEQAESSNKIIIQNLKKKLEDSKGKGPDELPGVLWENRTTAKSSKGEAPFSLVYGAEALIPMEIGI